MVRGKSHDYLGMSIDYSTPGQVNIGMQKYVSDMLSRLPAKMNGFATTPVGLHLFEVDPEAKNLDEDHAQTVHHNVAKLLFMDKRSRPDIHTPVAFLSPRVNSPDTDDWKKLGRVMKYLRATDSLSLMLECDRANIIKWWVDGSFTVHGGMKSHTGGILSLGKGGVYVTSIKQKINTKSSTESEVVAVYDILSQILWTNHFLSTQGCKSKNTLMYQDNISAMLLEQNGRAPSGKRTRHMNICHFYIMDKVAYRILVRPKP